MSRTSEEKFISAPIREAQEFERKAKAIRKAEEDFWGAVKDRLSELPYHVSSEDLSRIVPNEQLTPLPNNSDKWAEICRAYGADSDQDKEMLFSHLISEKQVNYYSRIVCPTGVQGE